jgi:hypothetical protein
MPSPNYWPTSSEESEDSNHASEHPSATLPSVKGTTHIAISSSSLSTPSGGRSDSFSLSSTTSEQPAVAINPNPPDFTIPVVIDPNARLPSSPSSVSSHSSIHTNESGSNSSLASTHSSGISSNPSTEEEEEEDEDYSVQRTIASTIDAFTSSNPTFWNSKPEISKTSALFTKKKLSIDRQNTSLTADKAELYPPHISTVRLFNSVFPLENIYKKWKDGVRVFIKTDSSRMKRDNRVNPCLDLTISRMLESNIIKETKSGPFESSIFLVPKSNGLMRPVINLHHLVEHAVLPRFYLPSVFQVIRNKPWGTNLYYIKYDFKNAFFNINVHKSSHHLFNFYYNHKVYTMTRLPFGASISPFVMQTFLNAISKYIRKAFKDPHVWGHLDDLIVAHNDPSYLNQISAHMHYLFRLVKWEINYTKSVINPALKIVFLGAIWSPLTLTHHRRAKKDQIQKYNDRKIKNVFDKLSLKM